MWTETNCCWPSGESLTSSVSWPCWAGGCGVRAGLAGLNAMQRVGRVPLRFASVAGGEHPDLDHIVHAWSSQSRPLAESSRENDHAGHSSVATVSRTLDALPSVGAHRLR